MRHQAGGCIIVVFFFFKVSFKSARVQNNFPEGYKVLISLLPTHKDANPDDTRSSLTSYPRSTASALINNPTALSRCWITHNATQWMCNSVAPAPWVWDWLGTWPVIIGLPHSPNLWQTWLRCEAKLLRKLHKWWYCEEYFSNHVRPFHGHLEKSVKAVIRYYEV